LVTANETGDENSVGLAHLGFGIDGPPLAGWASWRPGAKEGDNAGYPKSHFAGSDRDLRRFWHYKTVPQLPIAGDHSGSSRGRCLAGHRPTNGSERSKRTPDSLRNGPINSRSRLKIDLRQFANSFRSMRLRIVFRVVHVSKSYQTVVLTFSHRRSLLPRSSNDV
jgi:hypothetical protein